MLILCNMVLIVVMLWTAISYSGALTEQKNEMKRDNFCNNVDALKQVSQNYLITEKGYVNDWTAYIEANHMTAEEALEYIRTTNTQEERSAHLIDLDDMSARSTYVRNGIEWVHCYDDQIKLNTADSRAFLNKIHQMFEADEDDILVLGKYRVGESQQTVLSVGGRVTIREEDGSDKDYLLLRLVPVDYMQKVWIFPTEYKSAEISLIVQDGGYVVPSPSLRSRSFTEFIRGYNFQDNYNKKDRLAEQIRTTDRGLLEYKDSKGRDCYFYYSNIKGTDLDILGYVPVAEIQSEGTEWGIVLLVGGTLLVLMLLDGAYILYINRELRKANMAKTQFLSSMSHDIRTPMNAVIGMTEIARHHINDPAYVEECLEKVALSGNHLLTLVNDILDISKVESGKMTLNPAPFSIREMAEGICAMVRQAAAEKDICLQMKMDEVVRENVVGDALRLQQILINLLNNAIKYTGEGGHVDFTVSERPAKKEGCVVFQFMIADDGIGMSQAFQKTMYSTFSRATDSRINKIQGSGLGLAIAKQMVDLMNGTIACTSREGAGTTFVVSIELPEAENAERKEQIEEAEEKNTGFAGMRVLVAEDNDLNWEIVQIMLEEYGVEADWAKNGKLCVSMLKEQGGRKYDLVLMDVQMPEMDGREATRQIRADGDAAVREIPVVAMTADAFAEDVYACLEAGMDGHISKPIDIKRVLEFLRRARKGNLHRRENR